MVMVMEIVFFFGKVRWLFPFHTSKGLHRIFDRLLRKHQVLVCKSWLQKKRWKQPKNQKTILDVNFRGYIDYIPTLIHSFDEQSQVFFVRAWQWWCRHLHRRCSSVHETCHQIRTSIQGVTGAFSSCSLEDLDIGFMEWDMLFLQGHCWKSGGSSLKWGWYARSSKWWILDKELSQIDLADLKKAAPI